MQSKFSAAVAHLSAYAHQSGPSLWKPPSFQSRSRPCSSATPAQPSHIARSVAGRPGLNAWLQNAIGTTDSSITAALKGLIRAAKQGNLFRVAGLQARIAWTQFGTIAVAVASAAGTLYVWRSAQSAYHFVTGVYEDRYTFTVVTAGGIAGAALFAAYRQQLIVNPTRVHRLALSMLREDPAVNAVLAKPLAGGPPIATVVTGGKLHFKWGLFPRWRSHRIQMVFPVAGARAAGMALVEGKKRWGSHSIKLLAVDVPSRAPLGEDERIIVKSGAPCTTDGVTAEHVLRQMRAPVATAQALDEAYDREDAADDVELHAERVGAADMKTDVEPKPLEAGGGMYVYEKAYWNLYYGVKQMRSWFPVR